MDSRAYSFVSCTFHIGPSELKYKRDSPQLWSEFDISATDCGTNHLNTASDLGFVSVLVLLDLSAAFDHHILPQ